MERERYHVRTETFEGPFELLLYLVKNSKINLNDLSLSEITGQFVRFLRDTASIDVDEASNFIFTTSVLLYLKSRTLIPQEIIMEEDEADERREFIENLIEYQKYKNVASVLRKQIDEEKVLLRRETQLILDFKDNENWEEVSIIDLIIAFSRVAKEVDKSIFRTVEMEEISIDDKMNEILDYLMKYTSLMFHLLFPPDCSKYVLIITFLSLLELVKMKKIRILQHKLFGSIKIIRREE
jgi:segregation and condensation protein A